MSAHRWKYAGFSYYDRDSVERELEELSEAGWLLEKAGGVLWKYRRAEPKARRAAVLYVAEGSEFNSEPTGGQLELDELCQQEGWHLATRWGQMQVYYNDDMAAGPLETDPVAQVENLRRSMKKSLYGNLVLEVIFGLFLLLSHVLMCAENPADFLSSPTELFAVFMGVLLLGEALWQLFSTLRWLKKAEAAAEEGVFLSIPSHKGSILLFCLLPFLLLLIGFRDRYQMLILGSFPLLAVLLMSRPWLKWVKSRGHSRRFNGIVGVGGAVLMNFAALVLLGVTVIKAPGSFDGHEPVGSFEMSSGWEWEVYADELPLRLEDFQEELPPISWSTEKRGEESLLAAQYDYTQWPLSQDLELPDLHYRLTTAKVPALFPLFKKKALERYEDRVMDESCTEIDHFEPIDPAPWGADESYQHLWNTGFLRHYLLIYGHTLVDLNLPEEPTEAQKQKIGAKLQEAASMARGVA